MKKQNIHLLRTTAELLIKGASDTTSLAELIRELDDVKTAFESDPTLASNLSDRAVHLEKRESALFSALDGNVREDVLVALLHLLRHDSLRDLSGLLLHVERQVLERGTLSIAELKTADAVSKEQTTKIIDLLKTTLKKDVVLKSSIDPKLLGGFTLKTEETIVDASARGTLNRLKQALSE